MAVKIALAVGLFIVIYVPHGVKPSQVVPDGLVYTEFNKTLVRGVQGVLTCRFYGDPLAVYWKSGLHPDDLSTMVVWFDGEVSGPRYDDGSCDVDEHYSLFINNVSTTDAGRIHCIVLNYKSILMINYTDILVVDTALTTSPQVTLQMRQTTYSFLECTVHIEAKRVSWKKANTSSANESLVVIENNENVFKRSGTGYDQGTYNITKGYSLVIKKLQIHHEGLYVCEVTDDYGISFRSHTFVNVVAQPLGPFPTIQVAKSRLTVTCRALKYYPSINLLFLSGSRVLEPSDTTEFNNTDGTKNKTITIATNGNKEQYTCVASNIPGTSGNKSTSVQLHGDEPVKLTLGIILPAVAVLILISSVVCCIWRNKHIEYSAIQQSAPPQELEDIVEVTDFTKEDLKALEQRVNDKLMQHYRMICGIIGTTSAIQTEKIINENMIALFNTERMLTDMRERHISTRVKETIDKENEPAYDWPSDEELKTISCHLTQESITKICKELQIDYQNDGANDEGKWFESLLKWRTNVLHKSLEDKYGQLAPVFESNNLGGLLPSLRGHIYKAELVDMAFHLLMHDLFPIAKQLGINATKLVSYRPIFSPSHLEIGTIKLLIEPVEPMAGEDNFKRRTFCSKISNLYMNVGITVMLEYAMSYGELCSISEAINQSARRCADQEATSGMLPEKPVNLQDVLQLANQDIADHFDISRPLTAVALFKIWKEKPRPSIFNYRATLAHEIRRNNMPGLADDIIAGKYITEKTSHAFIEDMVRGLNQDQIRSLGELLQLSGDEEQWYTSLSFNEISEQIYHWVAGWTTDLMSSWNRHVLTKVTHRMKTTAEKHRDLNDKLVENGFLDLAREIMIIEQQLDCKYLTKKALGI